MGQQDSEEFWGRPVKEGGYASDVSGKDSYRHSKGMFS